MVVSGTSFPMWHNFLCLIMAGPALPVQPYHALVCLEQMRSQSRNEGKVTEQRENKAWHEIQHCKRSTGCLPCLPPERVLRVSLLLA